MRCECDACKIVRASRDHATSAEIETAERHARHHRTTPSPSTTGSKPAVNRLEVLVELGAALELVILVDRDLATGSLDSDPIPGWNRVSRYPEARAALEAIHDRKKAAKKGRKT